MKDCMTPRLEGPAPAVALATKSAEAEPRMGRASLRPWARVSLGQAFIALCLVSPAAAALTTPEEGEAQLFELLNSDRQVKLKPHTLLDALADWQAFANARRRAVGEVDDLGRDFRARCLGVGLIGKGSANVTADEFYFRTIHAYGGALIFDPMVEEAHAKRYDFVGIRCVEGDDGMFYWCIAFCRAERMDRLAGRDVPERSGTREVLDVGIEDASRPSRPAPARSRLAALAVEAPSSCPDDPPLSDRPLSFGPRASRGRPHAAQLGRM